MLSGRPELLPPQEMARADVHRALLKAYLATGESLRVAGGFTLDGLGGWFIDGVDGDPSAVVGIGLPLVRSLLGRAGLSIAALWAANPVT